MKNGIFRASSVSEAKSLLKREKGIIEVLWCGKDACGHSLEDSVEARLLGIPEDTKQTIDGKCVVCGEQALNIVRVALAY